MHQLPSHRDDIARLEGTDSTIDVRLGGQVSRIKTYGDLVTSIINPSHKLSRGNNRMTVSQAGKSKMTVYNEVMTVQQLVDLTTFLQDTYTVYDPAYKIYYYP
jgi:sulfur-oxidizing protein SoxX